ncbi:MAG: LysR family transcriptional regulator [Sphaerochaetaceae bacterium]
MELKTKLYLVDAEGEKFMGIGVLWLLCEVEKGQSLRKAASTLGISYSKAFLMVRNLEKALGVSVLNRQKGGADRGGATLTTFGQQFLKLYDDFQKQAKLQVEKPFNDFSAGLARLLESSEKIGEQEI